MGRKSVVFFDTIFRPILIHIVHRTPLMQFPDDVFITLTCTNGMVEVSFQSQSRLGAGDLNKNPERFADFHEHMLNSSFQDSCN